MSWLPRYSVYLRLLRLSLVLGAVYDFVLAGALAFAPKIVARLLGLPLPNESFYLWLIAFLLLVLAAFYSLAAYDPASYRGNVYVAIAGRTGAALVLAAAAQGRGDLQGLYVVAAVDLFFAVVHAAFYWPTRR